MMTPDGGDLDKQRQDLLSAKLGRLWTWSIPTIVPTVGPSDPSAFDAFDVKRRALVTACTDELLGFDEGQIELLREGREDEQGMRKRWLAYKRDEIDELTEREPPWYAGGFGHPEHLADFDYWAKMPKFSVQEILCLTVGIEPDEFSPNFLNNLYEGKPDARSSSSKPRDWSRYWPPMQFLMRQYELLIRKFDPDLIGRSVMPEGFISWAEQVSLEAHQDFMSHLRRYYARMDSAVTDSVSGSAKKADEREIASMATLLTAIAIDDYGYDPTQLKSPTPREMTDIVARLGLSLSDETVRKYLKLGASKLPPGWKDK